MVATARIAVAEQMDPSSSPRITNVQFRE